MELNQHRIHVVHIEEKVIKIFDNADEAIKYADGLKAVNIKTSVDPLYSFMHLHLINPIERLKLEASKYDSH